MNLPIIIQKKIEQLLECKINSTQVLYGGDINHSIKLSTPKGDFFVKWNQAKLCPGMFEKEASGLLKLAESGDIMLPTVIDHGECDDEAYLMLSFIEGGLKSPQFWLQLGSKLAALHKNTADKFGFTEDNYIGTLKQSNKQHDNIIDFYIQERLEPQVILAEKSGKISSELRSKFDTLYKKLPNVIPTEAPALLHGDLWSGNIMATSASQPCLIDPAVYYGHREIDLAMTKLFGGFTPEFYQAYHEAFPLEAGWEKRVPLFQLYPLLVHVNLFGGSYVYEVESIVNASIR